MSASESSPKIALAIQRLAPAGGLEQHCLRLAEILGARGADVTLLTTEPPKASLASNLKLKRIPRRGITNHGRLACFAVDAARAAAGAFDLTVAFHAIPGSDVIFCADPSRARPPLVRRWLPRYRTYARLEREALKTSQFVMLLSAAQQASFMRSHRPLHAYVTVLSPTVERAKLVAAAPTSEAKADARSALGLGPEGCVWLWMGLQPKTKGLDRAIAALRRFPGARLIICGLAQSAPLAANPSRLAARLGVQDQLLWLGFADRQVLRQAMAAADLLLHPSRADVTGTVILEALASGLPVVTTEVCGYAQHVRAADAGCVLSEPFQPDELAAALAKAADPETLRGWALNASAYAARPELYRGLEEAADLILASVRDP